MTRRGNRAPKPTLTCESGVTPCGQPARPYLCGPRCDAHQPSAYRPVLEVVADAGLGDTGEAS